MQQRQLGNSDLQLTVVGLGCWIMGSEGWVDVKDEESIAALSAVGEQVMATLPDEDPTPWFRD